MRTETFDLVVIGGGPAGIAGATEAAKQGIKKILLIEREPALGGILKQCIHNGFGLHIFKEELTGPEYAARWIAELETLPIQIMLETTVIDISRDRSMIVVNESGIRQIKADNILLAMGCRERTRGAIMTPGYRPAGVFTAGNAQKLVNINGYLPGKEVVIVGSGDIGLIMARRMTLEGAKVKLVSEIMPYSSGLARNIAQCVNDFDIPLRFKTTITKIHGKERVTGVTVASVDEHMNPLKNTEEFIACDTVLFSVGLIPENELSRKMEIELDPVTGGPVVSEDLQTSVSHVFACGNVVQVHDLVDHVSQEAMRAANGIAHQEHSLLAEPIKIQHDKQIRYVVPQLLKSLDHDELTFAFRSVDTYRNVNLRVCSQHQVIFQQKKNIVTPGEMITLTLNKKIISLIHGDLSLEMELSHE